RPALRPAAAGPRAGRRARRGDGVRRPLLRQERHPQHQARRVQAELLARSKRSHLDSPQGAGMSEGKKFYGLYRATVVTNADPQQIGRIQVIVPDVSNVIPTSWAMPCVPIAGKQEGTFMIPQVGAGVWVQFEQGDPDFPVWVGGFWGLA